MTSRDASPANGSMTRNDEPSLATSKLRTPSASYIDCPSSTICALSSKVPYPIRTLPSRRRPRSKNGGRSVANFRPPPNPPNKTPSSSTTAYQAASGLGPARTTATPAASPVPATKRQSGLSMTSCGGSSSHGRPTAASSMGLGTALLFVGETASGLSRETETSRISPGASKGLRTIHQTANAAIPQTASANAVVASRRFVISGPVHPRLANCLTKTALPSERQRSGAAHRGRSRLPRPTRCAPRNGARRHRR